MENTGKNLMLFPEQWNEEFDFDILGDKSYHTVCGIPVKVDRVIRDVTKTTVIGISGTMVIHGIKIRGVWDSLGNIMECRKTLQLTSPHSMFANIDNLFAGTTESMFRLVSVDKV